MKQKKTKNEEELIEETKILFEVQQELPNLRTLLDERLVNPDYIYKKIKILLEKITLSICPTNQLDIAKNYVKKWSKDLKDAPKEEL